MNEIILGLTEDEHQALTVYAHVCGCTPHELTWVGLDLLMNSKDRYQDQNKINEALRQRRSKKGPSWK